MEDLATTDWRDPAAMEIAARSGYGEQLFYHSTEHPFATRDLARELGKWCATEGQEVNFYVLDWASLFHDYGYADYPNLTDETKQRYPSREKYAAAMARAKMSEYRAPEDAIAQVEEAIWSTEPGVKCTSQEARILRRADLNNVGSPDIKNFIENTVKLFKEELLLNAKPLDILRSSDFFTFCEKQRKALKLYFSEDLSLGEFDRLPGRTTEFTILGLQNIERLHPARVKQAVERFTGLKLIDRAAS